MSNSNTEATFTIHKFGLIYNVRVVLFGGAEDNFNDQWQPTDTHQGGVTISVPNPCRGGYKFAKPLQCTLSELTASYAAQKRVNPSREAYRSLQDQYERDAAAGDYGFEIDAELNGFDLVSDFTPSYGFDWSYRDGDDLEKRARELIDETDILTEVLSMAKDRAAELVRANELLSAFVEG